MNSTIALFKTRKKYNLRCATLIIIICTLKFVKMKINVYF